MAQGADHLVLGPPHPSFLPSSSTHGYLTHRVSESDSICVKSSIAKTNLRTTKSNLTIHGETEAWRGAGSSSKTWSFLVGKLVLKPQVLNVDLFLNHAALWPWQVCGRLQVVIWGLWLGTSWGGRGSCGGVGSTGPDIPAFSAQQTDRAPCHTLTLNVCDGVQATASRPA